MGTEKKRIEIINRLKTTFIEANSRGVSIDRAKLVSEICINYGVTKIKAFEYIKLLIDSRFIKEEANELSLIKKNDILNQEEQDILHAEPD